MPLYHSRSHTYSHLLHRLRVQHIHHNLLSAAIFGSLQRTHRLSFFFCFTTVHQGQVVKGKVKGAHTPLVSVNHKLEYLKQRQDNDQRHHLFTSCLPLSSFTNNLFFSLSSLNRLPPLKHLLSHPMPTSASPLLPPHPPCLLCYILSESLSLSGLIGLKV